ncbi:rubredoxin-like domain-containing protein [Desulfobacter sp.]|uniref:rubredoxin-like domain-containing protein n=1 Tax=Desulfobacter sp. TaxID=2294 RepID=UPI003D0D878A
MKKWQCPVCKYIHTGDEPPEKCPVCGVSGSKFVPLEDDTAAETPEAETPATDEKKTVAPEKKAANNTETPNASPLKTEGRAMVYMKKTAELMLKHHAHPVTVHIPNGVIPVAAALFILSWIFGSPLLAKAGFINQVFVLIALPVVVLTGVLEWKKKYNQAQTTIFKLKIGAATVTAICCMASIIWYLVNPGVLESSWAWVFVVINLLMLAAAGVAGHIGGKLVFKD